jgi:sortase A
MACLFEPFRAPPGWHAFSQIVDVRTVGRFSRWAERLAWISGLTLLTWWVVFHVAGTIGSRRALQQFAALQSEQASAGSAGEATDGHGAGMIGGLTVAPPDQRLWSEKRIREWRDTLGQESAPPLAVLRIPRIGVETAVLEGTDDWTLNRAVGHIADTAKPGDAGNIGIAGHRDGFFRALKDVRVGDRLEVSLSRRLDIYRIERTWIVGPDDVSVLDPTREASVTLVTCYPFYFVGPAPQRFIVRAVRVSSP